MNIICGISWAIDVFTGTYVTFHGVVDLIYNKFIIINYYVDTKIPTPYYTHVPNTSVIHYKTKCVLTTP